MGCENKLNLTRSITKLHNHHHSTVYFVNVIYDEIFLLTFSWRHVGFSKGDVNKRFKLAIPYKKMCEIESVVLLVWARWHIIYLQFLAKGTWTQLFLRTSSNQRHFQLFQPLFSLFTHLSLFSFFSLFSISAFKAF